MNPKKIFITYFLLTLFLIASAVVFALEIKYFMRERGTDPVAPYQERYRAGEQVILKLDQQKTQDRADMTNVFAKNEIFVAMATPVPRPSPTPRPQPSPTPAVPGRNWKVNICTSSMAILKKYDNTDHVVKVGETVREEVHGDFKILAIEADMQNPRVKVQHLASGIVGFITKQGDAAQ
ncbi:MAG: hypothetical protein RBU29_03985 [bacterium]|jgi:hypothetical protein|nr:hypothetical protein [bacterium]